MAFIRDLVYDVGMHKGEDTQYYLARGFRVVAFEADPDLAQAARVKFKEPLASGRLTLIEGAIVEDDGLDHITFYKNKDVSVWGTVVKSWSDRNAGLGTDSFEIKVPVTDFLDVIARHGTPYYLKIDIEGMDMVCLRKLLQTDARPKYVSIESAKTDFSALKDEIETFAKLGYGSFYLQQQGNIGQVRIPRDSIEGALVDHVFEQGSSGPFGEDLPGPWVDADEAVRRYRQIFREYRWFGDNTFISSMPLGQRLLGLAQKVLGRPLPGWYDTHARLRS